MTGVIKSNDPFNEPSFTIKNRLLRVIWNIIYLLIFKPTPPQFHAWRACVLRIFGADIDSGCHVYSDVRIWAPWNLSMGKQSCLGPRVNCYNMDKIIIGNQVVVSQGTHLCTGSHDYESQNFQLITKPIIILDEAWICTECFIGPGVTIGEGAVIGARSVVNKNQPSWMVSAGNPSKPIKSRTKKHN
jgi:putative colanic acid biosynthesis acetyltransferase WcaF